MCNLATSWNSGQSFVTQVLPKGSSVQSVPYRGPETVARSTAEVGENFTVSDLVTSSVTVYEMSKNYPRLQYPSDTR